MQKSENRLALADFLRKQRARLAPTDVGLPPGFRRRTPGLRREEVAQLANIGISWYVWLEQGRNVHPSAQVLEGIAQALRLTPNERRHLFLLAGQAPPPQVPPGSEHIRPELRQMLNDLDPAPAYVLGRRWDYLAWNRSADILFSISQPSPPYSHNVIWRLFTNADRQSFPCWELVARALLAEFRTTSSRYPADEAFEQLIEDLKEVSPEFCRWWPQHDAPGSLEIHKTIEHPLLGCLEFEHLILQVFNSSDTRITIYMPNAVTRGKLQQFLEAVSIS